MAQSNKYSVLVVDDEEEIRSMIEDVLRSEGYNCLTAKNGKEAFEAICSKKIDAVISDILMPELGGIALLDKIKSRNVALPHLALISGFSETSIADIYDKGAEAFFSKPFQMENLIDTLKELLAPMDSRWKGPSSEMNQQVLNYNYGSFEEAEKEKLLLLGRGGFFLDARNLTSIPTLDSQVRFEFSFENDKDKKISGEGTVRWVRRKPQFGFNAGIGIEFNFLDEKARGTLVNEIKKSNAIPFIPKG